MVKKFSVLFSAFLLVCTILFFFLSANLLLEAKDITKNAQEFLENFSQTVCLINRRGDISQKEKNTLIKNVLKKNINIDRITKKILYEHYSDLSEEQIIKFKKRYLEHISHEYGQIMLNYRGIIKTISSQQISDNTFAFNTYSSFAMGKKFKIKYIIVMEKLLDRFYLYDIIFEDSISLLDSLRFAVREEIDTEGLDEFIESL